MSGFFLAYPGGLWASGAAAAVVVFYLFYRRFRPQPVTGLFLWGIPRREGVGGRQIEKPLFGRSILLDLLAAALFAVSLSGPAYRGDSGLPVVIILDDSFGMRARNAYLAARETGAAIWNAASDNGVEAAVVLAGDQPRVWRGMGLAVRGEAARLLADYAPNREAGDIQAAVALAQDLYGSALDIHIISNREDAVVAASGGRVITHVYPGRGGNLAIVGVWREPDGPSHRERLIFSLRNFGDQAVSTSLNIAGVNSSDPLSSVTVALAAGEILMPEVVMSLVGDQTLVATLTAESGEDVIVDDSRAYIPPILKRTANYSVEGLNAEAERYFTMALNASGCVPAPWDTEGGPPSDILITSDPEKPGGVVTLEVPPPADPGVYAPPYVIDMGHPLCRDLDLSAVPWVIANREIPDDVSAAFIMAGDMPLYWRSASGRLHLNLVPERCLIVNDPAWPVLMANLAAMAVEELPGLGRTLYRPGEAIRYNPGGESASILAAAGREALSIRGRDTPAPREPGLYPLRGRSGEFGEIAVIPDFGDASDASGLASSQKIMQSGAEEGGGGGVTDLTWAALSAGLLLLGWNLRSAAVAKRDRGGQE